MYLWPKFRPKRADPNRADAVNNTLRQQWYQTKISVPEPTTLSVLVWGVSQRLCSDCPAHKYVHDVSTPSSFSFTSALIFLKSWTVRRNTAHAFNKGAYCLKKIVCWKHFALRKRFPVCHFNDRWLRMVAFKQVARFSKNVIMRGSPIKKSGWFHVRKLTVLIRFADEISAPLKEKRSYLLHWSECDSCFKFNLWRKMGCLPEGRDWLISRTCVLAAKQ